MYFRARANRALEVTDPLHQRNGAVQSRDRAGGTGDSPLH